MNQRYYKDILTISWTEKMLQFMLFFLPMLLIFFVAATIHFYSEHKIRQASIENTERITIHSAEKIIAKEISRTVGDLLFIAEYLNKMMRSSDYSPIDRQQATTQLFHSFAQKKGIYDQLRFIDQNGMEQIRINYNDGQVTTVPYSKLQDKSERYYVKQGLELKLGEVYLSPMDLNIEGSKIEFPYKPVIRFVTPLYAPNGTDKGIIVLNYLGNELIQGFRQAVATISDRVHLLNHQGYWLSHSNSLQEWGFMFGNEVHFGNEFPEILNQVQQGGNGKLITDHGIFSYLTVNPLTIAQTYAGGTSGQLQVNQQTPYQWHVIAHLPPEQLKSTRQGFFYQNRTLYSVILFSILILSWLLTADSLRRKAFQLHYANELRFRDTLQEVHLAALTLTTEGMVLFCNNYLLQLLGQERDTVIGKNWFKHFTPKGDGNSIEYREQLLSSNPGQNLETEIIDHSGNHRLMEWTTTVTHNEKGEVENVTLIGEDITEQHKTREALIKLARAAEQSPAVIMITDTQGAIEYVNPKFTELTGYSFDEVKGQNPRILKSGETSRAEYHNLWKTITNGTEWRGLLHNRKKNGELYWESAVISAIRNEEGKISHYLSVKEDITQRKQLEADIEQQQRDLDRARTLAVVGKMASMVAHDLRNPLSSIKMGLQILSKRPDSDQQTHELCEIGLEQIRYMDNIMEGLLAYARPERLDISWGTFDKLIDTAISALQDRLITTSAEITIEIPPSLPTLQLDKLKMRRVLTNLLTNALNAIDEAVPDNPAIIIQAQQEIANHGSSVSLKICDNGTGIDPKQREALFEPFFTTRAKGTGLGLAIVRQIIEQHHGIITLHNNPPQGTCVVINLPTHQADPATTTFDPDQGSSSSPSLPVQPPHQE